MTPPRKLKKGEPITAVWLNQIRDLAVENTLTDSPDINVVKSPFATSLTLARKRNPGGTDGSGELNGEILDLTTRAYKLIPIAAIGGSIVSLSGVTDGASSIVASVAINGTILTDLNSKTFDNLGATFTIVPVASPDYVYAVGDQVTLIIETITSATEFAFTMKVS